MLSSISWWQFLGGFAVVALMWVLYVYRDEILQREKPPDPNKSPPLPATKRVWQANDVPHPANQQFSEQAAMDRTSGRSPVGTDTYEQEEDEDMEDDPADGEFEALEQITSELRQAVTDSKDIGSNTGLLEKIKPIIASYPELGHPSLRAAIQNMIVRAAFHECGLSLTTTELDSLWQ